MKLIKRNNSELVLIKLCLSNNRQAQFELFNKYKDAMYTLAYQITGNYNDAEDALQDTFINVFMNLKSFKGESTIGAWIKTILIRNSIKKTKAVFKYDDISEVSISEQFNIDDNLTGETIEKALLELNKGYRTVFVLSEVEGYKHREIAEILGISEGTSKSQLFHAKKQLKKKLQFA
ncbi:MAG: RNA polymerase sigma factor [Salinivirgaceae bacterium]|nr:RNA polymerase sigma factor [Salinivirgaceae bacterium]